MMHQFFFLIGTEGALASVLSAAELASPSSSWEDTSSSDSASDLLEPEASSELGVESLPGVTTGGSSNFLTLGYLGEVHLWKVRFAHDQGSSCYTTSRRFLPVPNQIRNQRHLVGHDIRIVCVALFDAKGFANFPARTHQILDRGSDISLDS